MRFKTLFFILMGVVFLSSIFSAVPARAQSLETLTQALIQKESRVDDYAVGDRLLKNKAYGCLQIRQPAVDDVNRRFGTNYHAQDCLGNRELSIWIFGKYVQIYATEKRLGNQPTFENIARIWNGGPNGFKKSSTIGYWEDVQKFL
ncbi:MAG: hypothetical protein KAR00_01960 [Candidatus Pacebacteria bacterium]|nr:hypothetical protein [Candidatus Paceibacterota bacterium]